MPKSYAGVKIAIRTDHEAGVVRAFLATMDEKAMGEIMTVSLAAMDRTPGLIDDVVAIGEKIMKQFLLDTSGIPATDVSFVNQKPPSTN